MEIEKLKTLPTELISIVKSYLPKKTLIFLNKQFYNDYHYLIKNIIDKNKFENYLREIIRRDNDFVFSHILLDFHKNITKIKNYIYKNVVYKNYYNFLIDYCIKNESIKCRNILNDFLKVQGLSQNRHKKNSSLIHIRWKY